MVAQTAHHLTISWLRLVRRPALGAVRTGVVLLGLTCAGMASALALQTSQAQASADFTVEVKDGLLTATFSDFTDDAALRAALPGLAARGVESLTLRGAPVSDLRLLTGMAGLKALDISGTQVRDISPLATLTGLRSLNLQFLRVSDLRPVAGMVRMQVLNLGGTDVRDLSPIGGMTEMRDLILAVTRVKELTPLNAMRQLTSLDLGSTWINDVRPLSGLTKLLFLSLNGTPVDDVRPLADLVDLRSLDLGGTKVADVQPLAGMHDLHALNLESTQVADITPLGRLSDLHSVAIGGSRVRDLSPPATPVAKPAASEAHADPDPVLIWNDQANLAIQATLTDAFEASRALAIESIAVLDTIKSIDGTPAFLVRLPAPHDISSTLAAAAAAHAVLTHLFPTRHEVLDTALAAALAKEPLGAARSRAVSFGQTVAHAVLMVRDEDGSMAPRPRNADPAPASGRWRPTPPNFEPAAHPQWATLQPFAMTTSGQFRPAGPPALETVAFRQARAYVASVGRATSATRTPEQTEIARYWSDAIGTYAPAGHWNAIAASVVAPMRLGPAVEAELFAELNVAMADASIAMTDAKYAFWFWRPITAIRTGDNIDAAIPDWTPLLATPSHPSYISGHSSFSGAAATVLTAWFGTRPFTFSSASLPGVHRHFSSFQQAADEAAASRVYGGIHFPFDNVDGLSTGRSIGAWTMGLFQRLGGDRGPLIVVMGQSMEPASKKPRVLVGCAIDNLAPLTTVSVQVDGAAAFELPVDDQGYFTLSRDRLGGSGRHEAVVTATSATGVSHMVSIAVE